MKKKSYKGAKGKVYEYLVKQPMFRERKYKNRGIANLLMEVSKPDDRGIIYLTKPKLTDIVGDIGSYDRAWRQILEHHEELRGSDYGDKDELVEKKQKELGYLKETL